MLKGLNKLKICYVYKHNMFRMSRLSCIVQKRGFYKINDNPVFINDNYTNSFGSGGSGGGGGGGGEDPKLFHIILLGFTIYSVNKLLK